MLILPLNNLPASVGTEIWIKVTNARGADLPQVKALSQQGEGLLRDRECDQRKAPVRYSAA